MRTWIQTVALQTLTTRQLRWVFRGLLFLTVIDWLMPDVLPVIDEVGLTWLTYEVWQGLRARKQATRDVPARDVSETT